MKYVQYSHQTQGCGMVRWPPVDDGGAHLRVVVALQSDEGTPSEQDSEMPPLRVDEDSDMEWVWQAPCDVYTPAFDNVAP